jgi:hypothetical protein
MPATLATLGTRRTAEAQDTQEAVANWMQFAQRLPRLMILDAVRRLIGLNGSTLQPATRVRIQPAVTVTFPPESSRVACRKRWPAP